MIENIKIDDSFVIFGGTKEEAALKGFKSGYTNSVHENIETTFKSINRNLFKCCPFGHSEYFAVVSALPDVTGAYTVLVGTLVQ